MFTTPAQLVCCHASYIVKAIHVKRIMFVSKSVKHFSNYIYTKENFLYVGVIICIVVDLAKLNLTQICLAGNFYFCLKDEKGLLKVCSAFE